nr:hypothetical protein [uncultured Ruegeria sp.]
MLDIPGIDDGFKQVHPGDREVLISCRLAQDFPRLINPQSVPRCTMCLTLVKPKISATLHIGVKLPIIDK